MNTKLALALIGIFWYDCYSANYYATGPCPDNYTVGEEWYDGCTRCSCDHKGYMCAGCGLVTYIVGCELIHDINATWPDCCPRLECPVFEVGR
ncbi:hypothetical protein ACJMK2_041251 [Sinanodonta woodiana]|uniref:Single domain-containing protein n=1 Tax=Sinanodonta woodiana TaxID=1069815 RepID=A0ABD3W3I3_SINWO